MNGALFSGSGPSLTSALSREDRENQGETETVPSGESEVLEEVLKDAFNFNRLNK